MKLIPNAKITLILNSSITIKEVKDKLLTNIEYSESLFQSEPLGKISQKKYLGYIKHDFFVLKRKIIIASNPYLLNITGKLIKQNTGIRIQVNIRFSKGMIFFLVVSNIFLLIMIFLFCFSEAKNSLQLCIIGLILFTGINMSTIIGFNVELYLLNKFLRNVFY